MIKYQSYSNLKNSAKIKLEGFFGLAITAWLLLKCMSYVGSSLADMLAPGDDTTSTILFLLLSTLVSVFVGAFNVGLAYFYLSLACGKPYHSLIIIKAFKDQPEKALKVSLVHTLINFVCTTPSAYFLLILMQEKTLENLINWAIVFGVGYVIYIPASLFLSQTWYLMVDFPNYTAKEVLLTGCKLMKKHFFRLLFLKISFLPVMLLGILSFGVGLIWIIPYKQMTYTCFYLDIMNPEKKEN